MSERKLVKVVVIDDVLEHPNADALEIAVIGGWKCCVKKGEFKPHDLGAYAEVDSMLPLLNPAFTFLSGRGERQVEGLPYARIRTMKLRGQLSQGIALPLSNFDFDPEIYEEILEAGVGYDLTTLLGALKYEKALPACLAGKAKGNFPSFIPKTDQERVQNISKEYEKSVADGELFEVSYKLDGSSFTAYVRRDGDAATTSTGVCSRNLELKVDEGNEGNTFIQTYEKYSLKEKLLSYHNSTGKSIAIQGEMVGPGIQKNFENLESVQLFIYNVFDIDKHEYMLPQAAQEIVQFLNLQYVPIFDCPMHLPAKIEQVLELADGDSGLNGKFREGLVFKSLSRDFSFKVISNKYLLKEE